MKHFLITTLLACSVSTSLFAGQTLHVKRCHRGAAPTARQPELQVQQVHTLIAVAARKHGVPVALVKGIVATESNFRCNVISRTGAVGLMQLQPATARQYGANPTVPEQNIDAGTRYLRFLIEKYRNTSSPLKCAIAAYNAGYGAVDRYRGVPPFPETQQYVKRVLARMQSFQS